jgi:hypothetical protein
MAAVPEADIQALLAEVKDLRRLGEEVRYLMDRQQILDVLALYGRARDRQDWELLENSVFHRDAAFDTGELKDFVGDARQLSARAERLFDEFLATSHVIANHLCEIDGDVAHAETYATTYLVTRDGYVRSTHARYVDRLEKRDGTWKIALRRIVRDAVSRAEVIGEPQPEGTFDRTDPAYQRPLTLPPDRAALIKP